MLALACPAVLDDVSLPSRYELAADMAACVDLHVDQDGFDLGDERCIHDCLTAAGFDSIDIDDPQLVEAAIDRVRRCRIDVRSSDIAGAA